MNVEIWIEAAQFPEKEYINGIFVAVHFAKLFNVSTKNRNPRAFNEVTEL
jgi:hypothetical protein